MNAATVRRCPACKGAGIIWNRLGGRGVEGQALDDGEAHPCRCWGCMGTGFIDGEGRPVHRNEQYLGK